MTPLDDVAKEVYDSLDTSQSIYDCNVSELLSQRSRMKKLLLRCLIEHEFEHQPDCAIVRAAAEEWTPPYPECDCRVDALRNEIDEEMKR